MTFQREAAEGPLLLASISGYTSFLQGRRDGAPAAAASLTGAATAEPARPVGRGHFAGVPPVSLAKRPLND